MCLSTPERMRRYEEALRPMQRERDMRHAEVVNAALMAGHRLRCTVSADPEAERGDFLCSVPVWVPYSGQTREYAYQTAQNAADPDHVDACERFTLSRTGSPSRALEELFGD